MAEFLAYVGGIALLYILVKIFLFVSLFLQPSSTALSRYQKKWQTWALITGASAGIGFGYAQELVARGFGVILLGHNENELHAAKEQLEKEWAGAEVKILIVDAVKSRFEDIERAVNSVSYLPITILINNVGGVPIPQPTIRAYTETDSEGINRTIDLNARFMSQITPLMIPVLAKNGPSLIVNMSSAGKLGLPWIVMYCATKGFVASFSKALAREAKGEGLPLDVIAIIPGDVKSQANFKALTPGSPNSRQFAKAALDRIGPAVSRGILEISPYWMHAIQVAMLEWMPEWLLHKTLIQDFTKKKNIWQKTD